MDAVSLAVSVTAVPAGTSLPATLAVSAGDVLSTVNVSVTTSETIPKVTAMNLSVVVPSVVMGIGSVNSVLAVVGTVPSVVKKIWAFAGVAVSVTS